MSPLQRFVSLSFKVTFSLVILGSLAFSQNEAASGQVGGARPVGAVKAVNANGLTITTDAGADLNIGVTSTTRIVRVAAGQKDLKSATPIQLTDIQTGDRALVRGTASADGKTVTASSIIVMKQSDIAQKKQQEREDWQKRGIGGLVTAVDPASGAVTISNGPGKTLMVQTTKATTVRRYSPDSVRFDDAKPGTLSEIKPGDQLRARGEKDAQGTSLQAEEIVSGTFRNIAGVVISADAANNTVTLKDLTTKKPVTIKVSADSQLRELPAMLAQRLAMRLKGGVTPGAQNTSTGERGNSAGGGNGSGSGGPPQGDRPRTGQPDLQQILSRMPAVAVSDLKKDEAVMVVATEGSAGSPPTTITLLTGVEPILTASPNDSRAATMLLSPWSLGGPAGDAGAQ